jgi:hypothetical protein
VLGCELKFIVITATSVTKTKPPMEGLAAIITPPDTGKKFCRALCDGYRLIG